MGSDELGLEIILPSAFGISIFTALLWLWPLGPLAKKRIEAGLVVLGHGVDRRRMNDADSDTEVASGHPVNYDAKSEDKQIDVDAKGEAVESEEEETDKKEEIETKQEVIEEPNDSAAKPSFSSSFRKMSQSFADSTFNQDLHAQSMTENAKAKEIWEKAELYDENAEMMFTYVQVFTACLNSFAHGGTLTEPYHFVHAHSVIS